MKNLNELQLALEYSELENPFFVVNVKEDNHENSGDANYLESTTFETLEKAFNYYKKELINISTFETESEYKELELIINDENDTFEVIETESYDAQYLEEDYGKFILHFLPKNDGISVSKVEVINSKTPFYVNDDKRFSVKSVVYNRKEDVIDAIYQMKLYISKEEAEELYNLYLE